MSKIIIGQEAICPDGLGRVVAYSDSMPGEFIQVSTYVNSRECKWGPHNVRLIDPVFKSLELDTGLLKLALEGKVEQLKQADQYIEKLEETKTALTRQVMESEIMNANNDDQELPVVIGVDAGEEGGDYTVAAIRKGNDLLAILQPTDQRYPNRAGCFYDSDGYEFRQMD